MLTRALAVELAQYNINVNCIAPSYIKTPIYEVVGWSLSIKENVEKMNNMVPMNRMGEAEEVAGAAFFLASDDSTYITGDTIWTKTYINSGLFSSEQSGQYQILNSSTYKWIKDNYRENVIITSPTLTISPGLTNIVSTLPV